MRTMRRRREEKRLREGDGTYSIVVAIATVRKAIFE